MFASGGSCIVCKSISSDMLVADFILVALSEVAMIATYKIGKVGFYCCHFMKQIDMDNPEQSLPFRKERVIVSSFHHSHRE